MKSPNLELFNKYWQLLEQYKNDEVQMGYFADMLIKNKPELAEYRRKIILFLQKIDYVDPLFNGEIGIGDIKVDGVACCMLWNACKNKADGHGKFCIKSKPNQKSVGPHRFMLDIVSLDFDIESELEACHECDNPPCCNPNHLFAGTHQDNMDNRDSKNRQVSGINVGNAKLTDDQVWAIYYDERQQWVIAEEYCVSQNTISKIKIGERKLSDPTKSLPKNQNKYSLESKTIKVTKEIFEEILEFRKAGWYQREIAEELGLSKTTISDILNGKQLERFK